MSENNTPSVAYFDSTFAEAMTLTREARDYVVCQQPNDLAAMEPAARMVVSCESMRVTARLTQVVAWLLVQKAVHVGELSREQAAGSEYRLSGGAVCSATVPVADQPLPEKLADLLDRSRQLYERVERLDSMVGRRLQ